MQLCACMSACSLSFFSLHLLVYIKCYSIEKNGKKVLLIQQQQQKKVEKKNYH
jgi:hypothetical protein